MKYNYSILFVIFLLLSSCGVSKKFGSAVNASLRPVLISQVAMATLLVESSKVIFDQDSIKPIDPILINTLEASFLTLYDTFSLHIDSVIVTRIETDSISYNLRKITIHNTVATYDKVVFPYLKNTYLPDTLAVKVQCEYSTDTNFCTATWRCLQSDYSIEGYSIKLQNKQFK
jgi:hypothetical protein